MKLEVRGTAGPLSTKDNATEKSDMAKAKNGFGQTAALKIGILPFGKNSISLEAILGPKGLCLAKIAFFSKNYFSTATTENSLYPWLKLFFA